MSLRHPTYFLNLTNLCLISLTLDQVYEFLAKTSIFSSSCSACLLYDFIFSASTDCLWLLLCLLGLRYKCVYPPCTTNVRLFINIFLLPSTVFPTNIPVFAFFRSLLLSSQISRFISKLFTKYALI